MQFPTFNADIAKVLPEYTKASPYANLLGIEITDARPGVLCCRVAVGSKHGSGVGAVHGGVLVSLVDHSLSLAVYPLVEAGKWVATLELKMNYLAPVPADANGYITCEAQVLSLKKIVGVVRADVRWQDQLVATATGTVYVKEPMKR